jgi:hypothetical protein
MEVTDDKRLPKEQRKNIQVETAHKKTPRAKIVKLADKTSNLHALLKSPAPDWSVRRKMGYIKWARKTVKGLRGANESLRSNSMKRHGPRKGLSCPVAESNELGVPLMAANRAKAALAAAVVLMTKQAAALSPTASERPFVDKLCVELNRVSGAPASLVNATPLDLQLVAYMDGLRRGVLLATSSPDVAERLRGMKSPAVSLAIAVKQLCRLDPNLTIGRAVNYIFVNGLAP